MNQGGGNFLQHNSGGSIFFNVYKCLKNGHSMHIRCFGLIMSFVRGRGSIFFTSTLGGVKLFLSWLRGGTGFLGPKIAGIGILGEDPQPVTGFRAKMTRDGPLLPLLCQYGKQSINRSYTIMPYFLYILFIVMLQTTGCKTTNSLKKATILRKIKQQESPYSLRHRLAAI